MMKIKLFYTDYGRRLLTSTLLLCIISLPAQAQKDSLNQYNLHIINTISEFKKTTRQNSLNEMWDLKAFIPTLLLDLKYSTNDNFLHHKLYPAISTSYLRKPAALALAAAQKELAQQGLGLKIWDAYRPYPVTVQMWEAVPDERYAANPKYGSGHNRGVAVDLTLINLSTGAELEMGTGFDHFSDTAHIDFNQLPTQVLQNRKLLQTTMEKQGFKVLDTEWWHFYLPNGKDYALLGISFADLRKMKRPKP